MAAKCLERGLNWIRIAAAPLNVNYVALAETASIKQIPKLETLSQH